MSPPRASALALTAILALAATGATAATARATAVSQGQVRTLAAQASDGDQLALAQLRAVTSIGGRPANLGAALNTRNPSELQGRLLALASSQTAAAAPSSAAAQQSAQAILAAQQFHGRPVLDPLQSGLQKLGSWLGRLALRTPGGPPAFWAIVGAVVLLAAAGGARRALRRLEVTQQPGAGAGAHSGDDPDQLEREAAAAEERGAFADAVRLRFRAGLLRVSGPAYRASMGNAELSRRLASAQFDVLAHSFDRIAYGGAPADRPDADAAREGWKQVLAESGARR